MCGCGCGCGGNRRTVCPNETIRSRVVSCVCMVSVPVTGFVSGGASASVNTILSTKSQAGVASALLSHAAPSSCGKLNRSQTGFYRVNYPADHWLALGGALTSFDAVDRLGVASDVFALFKVRAPSLLGNCCVPSSCAR